MGLFDSLPLVCVVNKAFFCVHGGISDKMVKVDLILVRWAVSTLSIVKHKSHSITISSATSSGQTPSTKTATTPKYAQSTTIQEIALSSTAPPSLTIFSIKTVSPPSFGHMKYSSKATKCTCGTNTAISLQSSLSSQPQIIAEIVATKVLFWKSL